jgi:hypothetical protein
MRVTNKKEKKEGKGLRNLFWFPELTKLDGAVTQESLHTLTASSKANAQKQSLNLSDGAHGHLALSSVMLNTLITAQPFVDQIRVH